MLIYSSLFIVSIASATTSNDPVEPKVPKININIDSVLKELGYNYTSETVPEKLMLQIMRSYQMDQGEKGADGELYYTITPDSPKAARNIIGTDSVIPYELPITMHVKSFDYDSSEISIESTDYLQEGKAALVFAIMDYPGEGMDLPSLQDAYDEAYDHITSCGQYTYTKFLTNYDCSHYYVWAWTTWACAEYSNVDVIWMGHGGDVGWGYGFMCYDGYWEWFPGFGGYVPNNFYYALDITSSPYDYSTLRVGMGDFCWGGSALGSTFVNPGGSNDHHRAFNGPETSTNTGYSHAFLESMGDWWYANRLNTWDASDRARNNAAPHIQAGENGWTYYNYGDGIWI